MANHNSIVNFYLGLDLILYCLSDVYDTSAKRRIPAWTDRILYKPNSSIQLLSYASSDSVRSSDHRPVGASFQCSLDLEEKGSRDVRLPLLRSESKSEVCVIS